jgi:hypothetical protein
VADTLARFAWLHRDALIAKLAAEIDAEADDAAALTHEARQQREAEVMGDLLSVERDESFLFGRRRRKICRSSIIPTSTRSHWHRAGDDRVADEWPPILPCSAGPPVPSIRDRRSVAGGGRGGRLY